MKKVSDKKQVLKEVFGFDDFRKGQEEIIDSLLAGKDCLAVMPTGQGKSLCYQLPAIMSEGTAVVISPLISLMKDQIDSLTSKNISATFINSSLKASDVNARLLGMKYNKFKIVYIAPERFYNNEFLDLFKNLNISLFVIDEAHCISQWGHDFRPAYTYLKKVIANIENKPPVFACTATATEVVQKDIAHNLNFSEYDKHVYGFMRPNLSFNIVDADNFTKPSIILDYIEKYGKGIIYCSTRKAVDSLSEILTDEKVAYKKYHAGLGDARRKKAQEDFMNGKAGIIVATNAFGMGIDRPDVRFVIHYQIPGSLEAYYQEAGRAGRDGKPSECVLLYDSYDENVQRFFIQGNNPSLKTFKELHETIKYYASAPNEITFPSDLKRRTNIRNSMEFYTALNILRKSEVIERVKIVGKREQGIILKKKGSLYELLNIDELGKKRDNDFKKFELMVNYVNNSRECRQKLICSYFGERSAKGCQNCDNCKG